MKSFENSIVGGNFNTESIDEFWDNATAECPICGVLGSFNLSSLTYSCGHTPQQVDQEPKKGNVTVFIDDDGKTEITGVPSDPEGVFTVVESTSTGSFSAGDKITIEWLEKVNARANKRFIDKFRGIEEDLFNLICAAPIARNLLIDAITGSAPPMHVVVDMCNQGLMEHTGNQWIDRWDWKRSKLELLDTNNLAGLYGYIYRRKNED